VRLANCLGQTRQVDAVRAGDEAENGLETASCARRHEHQRLDDLAELRTHGPRGLGGRVRRMVEDPDIERHASRRRGVHHALNRRGNAAVGHRGSLASGLSCAGAEEGIMAERSIAHALVVADGDPPDLEALDATWQGWRTGIDFTVAADGGARAARALGLLLDLVVGDGDSLGPAELEALQASGV